MSHILFFWKLNMGGIFQFRDPKIPKIQGYFATMTLKNNIAVVDLCKNSSFTSKKDKVG